MLKRENGKQMKMTILTLDELMPEKHFLRDLEQTVDFDFVYDIAEWKNKPRRARSGILKKGIKLTE